MFRCIPCLEVCVHRVREGVLADIPTEHVEMNQLSTRLLDRSFYHAPIHGDGADLETCGAFDPDLLLEGLGGRSYVIGLWGIIFVMGATLRRIKRSLLIFYDKY